MMVTGRFDVAALDVLCVDNTVPTFEEVRHTKDGMLRLAGEISGIIRDYPVQRGSARKQDCYPLICRTMEAFGWTLAGSGHFSIAFFRDGLVMKVGLKPRDSGLMYAAWCRMTQGRAGVPVLYDVLALDNVDLVLMDRCSPIAGELSEASAIYDPQVASLVGAVREVINQGVDGWAQGVELCRTALDIRNFFTGVARFDLHDGNFMLARDGSVVITDPVSFVGTNTTGKHEGGPTPEQSYSYTYDYYTETNYAR